SRAQLEAAAANPSPHIVSVAYGVVDGMRVSECNGSAQPAAWRTRDGRLWFATLDGAAVVSTSKLAHRDPPPAPVIESMQVDGATIAAGASAPPGPGELQIDYTAPNFVMADRLRFRYRLRGFESAWVDAGARRTAYYTNIPPGS